MPGMKMGSGMGELMEQMQPRTFHPADPHHASSGTSAEPNSTPTPMLMTMKGEWMLMFHANVFVGTSQQTRAARRRQVFLDQLVYADGGAEAGAGAVDARTMFSLEPATVTGRQYPLLFQQGETAFGKPIADGQHPHDFFMEFAALYDLKLGEKRLLSFYVAPMGDPAIGPTAYPHRARRRRTLSVRWGITRRTRRTLPMTS